MKLMGKIKTGDWTARISVHAVPYIEAGGRWRDSSIAGGGNCAAVGACGSGDAFACLSGYLLWIRRGVTMIKVIIKPIYYSEKTETYPDYLEKTIKIFGITVVRKKVKPIVNPDGNGIEFINRI